MSPQFHQPQNQPLPTQINSQPKLNADNDQYKFPYNPFPIWPYAQQDSSNDENKINHQQKFQSTFPLNYQTQPEKVSK